MARLIAILLHVSVRHVVAQHIPEIHQVPHIQVLQLIPEIQPVQLILINPLALE